MFGYVFLLLFIVIFVAIAYWYLKMPKNLPPGPVGLPYIGCAAFMKYGEEHLILKEWMDRFGKLFSFHLGNQLIVVLTDVRLIEEALINQSHVFNGRPKAHFAPEKVPPGQGILSSEGALWEERRNFIVKVFRELGEQKPIFETKIMEEIDDLLQMVGTKKTHAFDIQSFLSLSVTNIMCSIVFGKRFDDREVDFRGQMEHLTSKISTSQINFLSPINYFSFLMEIPVISKRIKKFMEEGDEIADFLDCLIKDNKIVFNPSEESTSYVHSFLLAHAHKSGKYFEEAQLLVSVFNLFIAGIETVCATLKWAIFLMAKYPTVQNRVAKEIHDRFWTGNLPAWKDRHDLPYTEATIMEIQRMANVVPMAVPHRTVERTTLEGYNIPENTIVVPFLWTVLNDPVDFPNPDKFDPTRFLNENGQLKQNSAFIPFSLGKRSCLGESFAKMEIFLIFTSLIAKFHFSFPRDRPNPSMKRVVGMTISPAPFLVVAKPRPLGENNNE